MKKLLLTLLICSVLCVLVCFHSYADELDNSLTLTQEEKDFWMSQEDECFDIENFGKPDPEDPSSINIKIYELDETELLAFLNKSELKNKAYIYSNKGKFIFNIEENTIELYIPDPIRPSKFNDWDKFYDYIYTPNEISFLKELNVKQVYCINTDYFEASHAALYYVTEKGEYALIITKNFQRNCFYLLTAEQFLEVAQKRYDDIQTVGHYYRNTNLYSFIDKDKIVGEYYHDDYIEYQPPKPTPTPTPSIEPTEEPTPIVTPEPLPTVPTTPVQTLDETQKDYGKFILFAVLGIASLAIIALTVVIVVKFNGKAKFKFILVILTYAVLFSLVILSVVFLVLNNQKPAEPLPTPITPDKTEIEELTPTPTLTPTPELTSFWDQVFKSPGVFNDDVFHSSSVFGDSVETWPILYPENYGYCARAFVLHSIAISNYDVDLSDDSVYTWKLYYTTSKSYDAVPYQSSLKGPYTLKLVRTYKIKEAFYKYDFSLVDCPEGDLLSELDLTEGRHFSFLICALKGEEVVNVSYVTEEVSDSAERHLELYRRFWETRDRSQGILPGMHPLTRKDVEDEEELGFYVVG